MYWLTSSDYTSSLCHCWSTANCFLNCLSFDTMHHSEKQDENKSIIRVTLLIKMLEQSTSAHEARRDDIWKYQIKGCTIIISPYIQIAKEKFICWIKDAFHPALRARFTSGLACGDCWLFFTSKCSMPGAENTRQISEPQFLKRASKRCHNAAQATASGN